MTALIETPTHPEMAVSRIVIGTRGSALALWQANAVRDALVNRFPGMTCDITVIRPEGDVDKTSSLLQIGGRGVFASALQEALLDGSIDLAVHSAKDVPTFEPAGLVIAAFPDREDARDAVVSRHGVGLADLPDSPVIGASSRRRAAQALAIRPDAAMVDLRGNVDTRLRKAASKEYDAVILAAAGLVRMGWEDRITEYLPIDRFVPSPGQGALAIETRSAPDPVFAIARTLDRPEVSLAVRLERAFLSGMGGGCTTPVGSYAELDGGIVRVWAMVASDNGAWLCQRCATFPTATAFSDVRGLATSMMRDVAPERTSADRLSPAHPLAGKHVLTTGTALLADRMAAAFTGEGAMAISAPTIQVSPGSTPEALAKALEGAAAGAFGWLVVTSARTIPALAQFGAERLRGKFKLAAVGSLTAMALNESGFVVDLVPHEQTGEGLAAALYDFDLVGVHVLCLLGNLAGSAVTAGLSERGAIVRRVESYHSRETGELSSEVREAVRSGRIDLVAFSSPSSVKSLSRLLGADLAALSGACLAAIGPTTQRAIEAMGLPVHIVAAEPAPEHLVAACRTYFGELAGLGK